MGCLGVYPQTPRLKAALSRAKPAFQSLVGISLGQKPVAADLIQQYTPICKKNMTIASASNEINVDGENFWNPSNISRRFPRNYQSVI